MQVFSSRRERRLWEWVLVVVLAMCSTLCLAQVVVQFLREQNLMRFSFALIMVGIAAAVICRWVRQLPSWMEIGVWVGVPLVYMIAFVRVETPEERTHLIEYSLVAVLIYQALLERSRYGREVRFPAFVAFFATVLLGMLDEMIQWLLLNRYFDPIDVGFIALAAFMAITATIALAPVRGRRWRRVRIREGVDDSKKT
jgi:ribose/xylose/arabinose/galactoside ABC-type transport system permease subunit